MLQKQLKETSLVYLKLFRFLLLLFFGILVYTYLIHKRIPTQSTINSFPENSYTEKLAIQYKWKSQVKTKAGTYCDLVTPTTAIEVEWTTKPYEAVGQSLHYSQELNLRPGIVFLLSPEKPPKSYALNRIKKVSKKYGIEIWWYDTQTSELKKELE